MSLQPSPLLRMKSALTSEHARVACLGAAVTAGLCLAAAVGIEAYDFLTSKLDERMQRKAAERGQGGRKPPGSRAWYRLSPEGKGIAYGLVALGGALGVAGSLRAQHLKSVEIREAERQEKILREREEAERLQREVLAQRQREELEKRRREAEIKRQRELEEALQRRIEEEYERKSDRRRRDSDDSSNDHWHSSRF